MVIAGIFTIMKQNSLCNYKQHEMRLRITIFGLSYNDIYSMPCAEFLNNHEVYFPASVNDIFALNQDAVIINPSAICELERNLIIEYYTDLIENFTEIVFWVGYPKPPFHIRAKFYCCQNVGELSYALPRKLKNHIMADTWGQSK